MCREKGREGGKGGEGGHRGQRKNADAGGAEELKREAEGGGTRGGGI